LLKIITLKPYVIVVKDFYASASEIREDELRNGGQRREVSRLRAKTSSHLSHEMGIPMAEIARDVGVCG